MAQLVTLEGECSLLLREECWDGGDWHSNRISWWSTSSTTIVGVGCKFLTGIFSLNLKQTMTPNILLKLNEFRLTLAK